MKSLRALPTFAAQMDGFAQYLRDRFGYDGLVYAVSFAYRNVDELLATLVMEHRNMDPQWMAEYFTEKMPIDDYSIEHSISGEGPITHQAIRDGIKRGEIDQRFKRVADAGEKYVKSGFFLPLHSGYLRGGMGFHSNTHSPEAHDRMFAQHGERICELAHQFHDMVSWHDTVVAHFGITARNLEVLQLKAQGLTVKEILFRLDRRNPKTVENHMNRLAKILQTRNDSETVLKATRIGLINPFSQEWEGASFYDC